MLIFWRFNEVQPHAICGCYRLFASVFREFWGKGVDAPDDERENRANTESGMEIVSGSVSTTRRRAGAVQSDRIEPNTGGYRARENDE